MTSPLSPRGTLRARFEPQPAADMFRRLGLGARSCDLGDEGLYLAEELVAADQWFGGRDPLTLGVLVLALLIAQRQGSTCLPLDPAARGPLRTLVGDIARFAGLDGEVPSLLKAITRLTGRPQFDSVVGTRDQRLPLVVDLGCLYTERARWLEDRVARRLTERLNAATSASGAGSTAASTAASAAAVADLARRPGAAALSDEQIHAVRLALTGRLAVVTGGPGTGKTVVAAAIVRGFARLGIGPIALAAQTGKAANRLTEVIGHQLAAIRRRSAGYVFQDLNLIPALTAAENVALPRARQRPRQAGAQGGDPVARGGRPR